MIAIIDGCGTNITSIEMALQRLGYESVLTADREAISAASHVILPGVGNAAQSMRNLQQNGLYSVIPTLRQPVLGICVGMQILFTQSAEGDVTCLNIIEGTIKALPVSTGLVSPHMGWNQVFQDENILFKDIKVGSDFYFANSYYAPVLASTLATTEYGLCFSAAVQKDNFFGVQFHPEKSGEMGLRLLTNFLNLS
jgi:glutamine amidotransferase